MLKSFRKRENNNLKTFKISVLMSLLFFSFSFESEGQVLESDSLALVDIYNSTGGENWNNSTNWLTVEPVASWFGITVSGGRVTGININNNNLQGSFPMSLNNLTALETLWFPNNQISELPIIANLSSLIYLNCTNNLLSNMPNLTNLSSLQEIVCSHNQLISLPDLSNLTALTNLDCKNNQIANLPDLSTLINLSSMYCEANQLTDISELSNLNSLITLWCYNNLITDLTPISNISSLNNLLCSENPLDNLPDLSNLINLKVLTCDAIQLTSLPDLSSLTALETLSCRNNLISELPDLSNLTSLTRLICSYNQLGSLPNLDNLTLLQELNCYNNNLMSLPDVSNLTSLKILNCGLNPLTSLPNLENLILLEQLRLDNVDFNYLPNLDNFPNLTVFYCQGNGLSFKDLEPVINHPNFGNFSSFFYAPQNPSQLTITAPPVAYYDSLITLTVPFDGINTQYQWSKNGIPITEDDTSDSLYTFTVSSFFQKGDYSIEITHPSFPLLTFQSLSHNLSVNGIDSIGGIFIPNQIIVEYADEAAAAENLHLQYGAIVVDSCDCTPLLEVWEFEDLLEEPITFADNTRSHDINEAKKKSQEENDSCLDHVDFNYITANSSRRLAHVRQKKASIFSSNTSTTSDDTPIKIALIDSGFKNDILQTHNYQYTNWQSPSSDDCSPDAIGYNFINGNAAADTLNNNLHASHMAAIMLNEAPENAIELMNLKAFGTDGGGLLFNGICAMHYALKHEANIVNLSWSYHGLPATVIESALMRLQADSTLVFTSAGNGLFEDEINPPVGQNTKRKPFYPGAFDLDNVITVAASNGEQLADFSNYSDSLVQVAAPGWMISPWDGATALSGSSQATAFASGMAAAYWHNYPNATPSEVKMALQNAAALAPLDSLEWGGRLESLVGIIEGTDVDCNTGYGSATATVRGGFSPYTFEWSTGDSDATIANLVAGTHDLTITDDVGVQRIYTVTIAQCTDDCPPNLVIGESVSSQTPVEETGMNIISNSTLHAPTDMTYKATESVTLEGGFTVDIGASFNAMIIANCDALIDSEVEERSNDNSTPMVDNLKIYPNPAQNIATLAFDVNSAQVINLTIYDSMGRLVQSIFDHKYVEDHVQIPLNISDWNNGIYYCHLWSEQLHQVVKVLVFRP